MRRLIRIVVGTLRGRSLGRTVYKKGMTLASIMVDLLREVPNGRRIIDWERMSKNKVNINRANNNWSSCSRRCGGNKAFRR